MATTYNDNGGATPNGSVKNFTFTFPYLKTEDVKVALNGITQATTKYSVNVGVSPTRIEFNNTSVDSTVQESDGSPKTGVTVRVYRDTDVDAAKAVFAAGSSIRSQNLNDNQDQVLYALQEEQNQLEMLTDADINPAAEIQVSKLKDGTARQLLQTDAAGTGVEWTSNIDVPGTLDVTGAVDFDSNLNVDGTLTVDGVSTLTGNVTVGGTVDGRDVAADGTKLDGIEAGATADQTNAEIRAAVEAASDSNVFTDADHSKLNAIEANATADQTAAEIKTLYESNSDTNEFSDAEQTKLAGIEVGAKDDQTDAEIRAAVEAASDSNVFTDADHTKLNAIEASADVTDATNVDAAGAVMNADTTTAAMQFVVDEDDMSSNLDTKVPTQQSTKAYITATSQPLDAQLTTLAGSTSGTASIIGDGSKTLTADIDELNLLDGKSVVTSISGNATDVQLPSAQAVNERIVELVTEVGGFHPIANETSFPATNPDINDGAGTIVSIKALSSAFTLGSGVTTKVFTNGAGSGVNVTVNGLTASTTYPAGRGMLLETTSTLHTYNFHRLTLDETGVADAQAAIDDFDERYYGPAASAPSTRPGGGARADGDMYFNTSDDKMKVWNNSDTSWDDVATSASSFISTLTPISGSGNPFDGSQTTFTPSSVPIDAQSAIISINGVIQKPNSGTSQPSEGFAINANDKILFATAPPSGADYFMITLGNAVSIGTPSPNTVGASQLQSNAVEEAKIATGAVTTTKLADDSVSNAKLTSSGTPANRAVSADTIQDDAVTSAAIAVLDANLQLGDNVKIQLGVGNDLELNSDGENGQVTATQGNLWLKSDTNVFLSNEASTEYFLKAINNGAVELYHNNHKSLETNGEGIVIRGGEANNGVIYLYADEGDDNADMWTIQAKKTASTFTIQNNNAGAWDNSLKCHGDGSVELYYDNTKKFWTKSDGAEVEGTFDADRVDCNGLFHINYASSTDTNYMSSFNNNNGNMILFRGDGIYVGDNMNTSNQAGGPNNQKIILKTNGTAKVVDDAKFIAGSGDDLSIYHDGTNSYIKNITGDFIIQGVDGKWMYLQAKAGEDGIILKEDAAVELFYDGTKKFDTASHGADFHSTAPAVVGIHSTDGGNTSEARLALGAYSSNPPEQRGVQVVAYNMDAGHHMDLRTSNTHSAGPTTKMRIQNDGYVNIPNDDVQLRIGADNDIQLYHSSGVNYWKNQGSTTFNMVDTGGDKQIECNNNGNVELYYNGSKRLETTSTGIQISGSGPTTTINGFADLKAASGLTIFSTNDTDGSQYGIMFAGADHDEDGCNAGIIANHENVAENSETTTLDFYTSISELYYRPLHLDNGVRIGPSGPVSSEIFTVQRTGAKVAYFDKVGSGTEVGVTMRHGRGLSGYTGDMVSFLRADSTEVGKIVIGASETGYNTNSDYRLKENQVSISDGITRLKSLKPYRFNFKDDPGVTVDGFFAHEVQSVVPNAITGTKDEVDEDNKPIYQSIDKSKLVPLLTAALQEAITKIETLETKVAALEAG